MNMNPYAVRYLEKFEALDGSLTYTFPIHGYQLDLSQGLRSAFQQIIGADYAVDLLGAGLSPKDTARGAHHVYIVREQGPDVDAELEAMRRALYSIGQGRLFFLDANEVETWVYARLNGMPSTTWKSGDLNYIAVVLDWTILSDQYAAEAFDQDFPITADPAAFLVPNPGTARVYNAVITFKGPWIMPSIMVNESGYHLALTRQAFAGSEWFRLDCGPGLAMWSTDSGVSWRGDFLNVSLPPQQVQFLVLVPGDNVLVVTGCNGGFVHVHFNPAFD